MFRRKQKASKSTDDTIRRYMPDKVYFFADGTPFPAEPHLRTMEWIARCAWFSDGDEREVMFKLCTLVMQVIQRLPEVDPTPEMLENLHDGRAWLETNRFPDQAERFTAVWQDMGRYWDESGAIGRMRDHLRDES